MHLILVATFLGFSDLNPYDGGWSQNPMQTVSISMIRLKGRERFEWNPMV